VKQAHYVRDTFALNMCKETCLLPAVRYIDARHSHHLLSLALSSSLFFPQHPCLSSTLRGKLMSAMSDLHLLIPPALLVAPDARADTSIFGRFGDVRDPLGELLATFDHKDDFGIGVELLEHARDVLAAFPENGTTPTVSPGKRNIDSRRREGELTGQDQRMALQR
jgi:hypothetical protein